MIPEHKVEEVLRRIDIVSLISRYTELKKAGREFRGRCPFHQEKTPSFYVNPDKGVYICYGCHAGGNAFSFVQRYLGKNFADTVRDLARELGVDLEAAQDPAERDREHIKQATDFATEHFKTLLWNEQTGRDARAYLASRGVSAETARLFGLGWAPPEWTALADRFLKAGMIEWGTKAGLVLPRSKGDGYFDFFRSRLMIPIRSPEGRTIGFGGRLLGSEDGAKYLNSKDSVLYNKSNTLYGMDQARDELRRRNCAVLVEGYFDCIGLHQAGVRHAVALCSTALTHGHLSALKRAGAKNVVLLLDGDSAGIKAVERLAGPLLAAGVSAQVALLPMGDDPDTFARREGPAAVESLINQAQPLTAHLFGACLPRGKAASFEEKMEALERLKPVAAYLPAGLIRSAFFNAMGTHFGLPPMELEASMRSSQSPHGVPKQAAASVSPNGLPSNGATARLVGQAKVQPPDELEALYVAALLRSPRLITRDQYRVSDELTHPGLRLAQGGAVSGQSPADVLFDASEEVKYALENALRKLPPEDGGHSLEQYFVATCRALKLQLVDRRRAEVTDLLRRIPREQASDLPEEVRSLLEEKKRLNELRKRLDAERPL
ncbi:DNA primase [Archangium sp.]|uniref:DNA primase n=1 Tax=Archangium sp. TaxID=1872627 RepID=UPI002ED8C388